MRERKKKRKLAQSKASDDSQPDSPETAEVSGTKDVFETPSLPIDLATESNSSIPEREEGASIIVEAADRPKLKRGRELDSQDVQQSRHDNDKRQRRSMDLQTKVINGKVHVVIPNQVATKDVKKFRKDARRQLRLEGKEEADIVFVDEDELPPEFRKSKKKKEYPSIKELLQQKKQEQVVQKEDQKQKAKIQEIPDEIKSQYIALDCEMVGIGTDGKKSALARVSIVDWDLNVVLDSFVKVPIRVTDFRTHVSGVEPKHIKAKNALEVEECRNRVAKIIKDKVLVGHALTNDFKALMLNHPKAKIRDTATYRPFQRYANGKWRPRKLRDLVKENIKGKEGFQSGEHDSVQDAQATMELFQVVRAQWEKELANKK